MLNWSLLKNPLNWFVVWTMLLIAGYTAHLILSHYQGVHPGAEVE